MTAAINPHATVTTLTQRRAANVVRFRSLLFGTCLTTAVVTGMIVSQASGATLIADGRLDAGYQLGFTMGFLDDKGNSIGDGRLFFGVNSSDNTQFLYFQLPKNYVDNTYGNTAAVDWTKGHTFGNLYGSDRWGVYDKKSGTGGFGWNGNSVTVDYIAGTCADADNDNKCDNSTIAGYRSGGVRTALNDGALDKNDGSVNSGSASSILEIATSLEYNFNQYGTTYLTNSPAMTSNTTGNISYASAVAPNWIYDVGYEIQFAAGTFDPAAWLGPLTAPSLITLGVVHASPSKQDYSSYDTPVCIVGCSPDDHTVPEPGSTLLLGSGLGLLAWLNRRRHRRPQRAG